MKNFPITERRLHAKLKKNKKSLSERGTDRLLTYFSGKKIDLDRMLNTMLDGIVITDSKGIILWANRAMASMIGLSNPEEGIGKQAFQYIIPSFIDNASDDLAAINTKEGGLSRCKIVRNDGREVWVEILATAVPMADTDSIVITVRDIKEHIENEKRLKNSEERYRTILDAIEDGYFEVDLNGMFTYVNDALCRSMGYESADELIGKSFRVCTDEITAMRLINAYQILYRKKDSIEINECEIFNKQGARRLLRMKVFIKYLGSEPAGFRGVFSDITDRKETERILRESEERYRTLFEKTSSPIIIIDPEGNFIDCNEAALIFFECERNELMKRNVYDFLPPERREVLIQDRFRVWKTGGTRETEYSIRGKTKYLEIAITPTMLQGKSVVFCVGKDMTDYKETEKRLAHMAMHDQLTGLPNRVLFNDRLSVEISKAVRNKGSLAVLFLDLDHFKTINDTLGHSIGDLLLKALGARLMDCLRKSDTVARMGGDEFIILLPDIAHDEDVEMIAEKILATIRRPFLLEDQCLEIKTSLGIALYPDDGEDPELLIKKADTAMYRAKASGRDNFKRYRQ
ncbi:MAG: sensor domain-containing diguanylate cyclase [Syntrophales bacterium]|nr:sensor domain-containing diguanylate cyclase [Syntrophales bacterium]MDY0044071.1 sensor domain-containing diguanylate cyclase [Syntrophales bacterium]